MGEPMGSPTGPPSALCARSPPVDLRPRCLAQQSTRGRPGTSPTYLRTRTWCPSGLQHRRRGFDSFRPCSTCRRGPVSDDPNDPPCRSPMRPAAGIGPGGQAWVRPCTDRKEGPVGTTVPPCSCPGRLAGQDAGLSHRWCGFESRPGYRCDRGVRSEAHGVASAADRVRVPAVALRWGSWWPRWWLATTRTGFDSPGLHSHPQTENRSRRARSARVPRCVPCRGLPRAARPPDHAALHALGRAWWRGSAVSRVRRVRLPPRALLAVAQRIRAPPCEGGGRRFESSRRDSSCSRARFRRAESRRSDPAFSAGRSLKASASPPQLRAA